MDVTRIIHKRNYLKKKTIRLVGNNKSKHEMKQTVLLNQLSDSILELNKKDPSETWKLTNLASVSLEKSICHRIKNRQRNYTGALISQVFNDFSRLLEPILLVKYLFLMSTLSDIYSLLLKGF